MVPASRARNLSSESKLANFRGGPTGGLSLEFGDPAAVGPLSPKLSRDRGPHSAKRGHVRALQELHREEEWFTTERTGKI